MSEAFESTFSLTPMSPDDRRRADRRGVLSALKTEVRVSTGSGQALRLRVSPHDVSPFGVGFWHSDELPEGAAIEFVPIEESVESITGVIVRSNAVGESLYEVGVRFHDEISVKRFLRWFVTPRASVA